MKENELMAAVQRTGFALTELCLFLDTHPSDAGALSAYRNALTDYNSAVTAYEAAVGPLCIKSAANGGSWSWTDQPWPWENRSV